MIGRWLPMSILVGSVGLLFAFSVAAQQGKPDQPDTPIQVDATSKSLPAFPILERVDGDMYTAQLVSLDEAWNFTFETQSKQIILPLGEISTWGSYLESIESPMILLRDGSCLAGDVTAFDQRGLTFASRLWQPTHVAWDEMLAVLLRPPLNSLARDQWLDRLRETAVEQDVLFLANGDELHCTVLASPLPAEQDVAKELEQLTVRVSQAIVQIDRDEVIAIRFRPARSNDSSRSTANAWLQFRDGTRINCSSVNINREAVQLQLSGGQVLESRHGLPRPKLWSQVTEIRPVKSNPNYLSDMTPARFESIPFWGRTWEYARDRSVVQGALRHDGKRFQRGIGMHATSSLAYVLDKKVSRFRAWVGIDETAAKGGSVIFRVYQTRDGTQWEEVFRSSVRTGTDPLLPIDLDISDCFAITISVDQADGSPVLDRANWIEARFE